MGKLFTSAKFVFGFPAVLFIFNLVSVISAYALNFRYGGFFISASMHFLGGASMAIIFFYFWERNPDIYSFKRRPIVNLALVLGFVALIGVLWEFHEFLLDFIFPNFSAAISAQARFQDLMADLFFDLVGGFAAALLYFRSNLYKESPLSK